MTAPVEIQPNASEIPAGWPRPYYLEENEDGKVERKYVQWITGFAKEQIHNCSTDRTNLTAEAFACTSCAEVMEKGVMIDVPALSEKLGRWDVYDSNYGGAICFRCVVFAFKACPWFAGLVENEEKTKGAPVFCVVDGPDAYTTEIECSGVSIVKEDAERKNVTSDWLKAEVKAGRMYLTGRSVA